MLEQENRRPSKVNELVKRDIEKVSGLKELLGNLEANHEQLRATVARHGDELVETRRWNSELGVRVQRLEEEDRRLCESSEGLKSQMTRAKAGQQNAVPRLQEEIAAGDSKANQNMTNLDRELAKLKEKMRATRPKAEPLTRPAADVAGPTTSSPPVKLATTAPGPCHRRLAPGSHRPKHQQTHRHRHLPIHPRNRTRWDRIREEWLRLQNNQLFRRSQRQPPPGEVIEQRQLTAPKGHSTAAQTGTAVPPVGKERQEI
jgi:hypothetical protein